jgi:hypothetical protein
MKGGQQYQFNQLKDDIQRELSRNSFPITMFNTINNISRVINAIRLTKGNGWAAKVVDDNGQPLFTQVEQQRYTELFKPYLQSIILFFNDKDEDTSGRVVLQQGGDEPAASAMPSTMPSATPSKKKGKLSGYSDKASGLVSDAISNFDLSSITPDVLFDNIMSKLMSINTTINETAEAVNFTHDLDEKPDVPLGSTGIMISPRLIIFLIYYVLDITRIAIGVSGNDTGRKILSVVVSILELVRGDWKKALLTFIGYFGMSPMLVGTLLKTYLSVIQMLSPTLQIKLPYFMFDSMKSIIFGVILSVIQLGAPKLVRDQIDSVLEKLSSVQRDIDTKLNNLTPPLQSRPDYLKADFSDLNNLQSILDDPVYVCSAEHRAAIDDLLASVGKEGAPAVQLVLSLMRYPHTSGMTKYLCDNKAKKSYVDLLVEEGLQKEATQATEAAVDATETAVIAEEKANETAAKKEVTAETAVEKAVTAETAVEKVANTKGGKRNHRTLRKSAHHK